MLETIHSLKPMKDEEELREWEGKNISRLRRIFKNSWVKVCHEIVVNSWRYSYQYESSVNVLEKIIYIFMMLGLKFLASMYTKEKEMDLSVLDLRSYEENEKNIYMC